MKIYSFNKDGFYIGQQNAKLDPLETEKQKKNIYLLPSGATFLKPPKEEKDKNIVWNIKANIWEQVEKEKEKILTIEEIKDKKTLELRSYYYSKEVRGLSVNNELFFMSKENRMLLNEKLTFAARQVNIRKKNYVFKYNNKVSLDLKKLGILYDKVQEIIEYNWKILQKNISKIDSYKTKKGLESYNYKEGFLINNKIALD